MSGVRMGERVLQIGLNDPLIAGMLAAKPGLSGHSAIVVLDQACAERARETTSGALVEITVGSLERLPFEDGAFDLAVIHNREGLLAALGAAGSARFLAESRRVLRSGGRVMVLEAGTPSGLGAIFRTRTERDKGTDKTLLGLEAAGFRATRILGDRDGYRFVEAMKWSPGHETDPAG